MIHAIGWGLLAFVGSFVVFNGAAIALDVFAPRKTEADSRAFLRAAFHLAIMLSSLIGLAVACLSY